MLNTLFSSLTASQQAFVNRVCADLRANLDAAQVAILADGFASPNDERYAAKRLGQSWEVVFNFPQTDAAYRTAVQLPVNWRLAA